MSVQCACMVHYARLLAEDRTIQCFHHREHHSVMHDGVPNSNLCFIQHSTRWIFTHQGCAASLCAGPVLAHASPGQGSEGVRLLAGQAAGPLQVRAEFRGTILHAPLCVRRTASMRSEQGAALHAMRATHTLCVRSPIHAASMRIAQCVLHTSRKALLADSAPVAASLPLMAGNVRFGDCQWTAATPPSCAPHDAVPPVGLCPFSTHQRLFISLHPMAAMAIHNTGITMNAAARLSPLQATSSRGPPPIFTLSPLIHPQLALPPSLLSGMRVMYSPSIHSSPAACSDSNTTCLMTLRKRGGGKGRGRGNGRRGRVAPQ